MLSYLWGTHYDSIRKTIIMNQEVNSNFTKDSIEHVIAYTILDYSQSMLVKGSPAHCCEGETLYFMFLFVPTYVSMQHNSWTCMFLTRIHSYAMAAIFICWACVSYSSYLIFLYMTVFCSAPRDPFNLQQWQSNSYLVMPKGPKWIRRMQFRSDGLNLLIICYKRRLCSSFMSFSLFKYMLRFHWPCFESWISEIPNCQSLLI